MCNFRVWVQTADDLYVLQCTECGRLEVRLGNASFMFGPAAYQAFCHVVGAEWRKIGVGDQGRPHIIPTFNDGMDLLLNIDQLRELYLLLDAADTEMQTARMSSLFH